MLSLASYTHTQPSRPVQVDTTSWNLQPTEDPTSVRKSQNLGRSVMHKDDPAFPRKA